MATTITQSKQLTTFAFLRFTPSCALTVNKSLTSRITFKWCRWTLSCLTLWYFALRQKYRFSRQKLIPNILLWKDIISGFNGIRFFSMRPFFEGKTDEAEHLRLGIWGQAFEDFFWERYIWGPTFEDKSLRTLHLRIQFFRTLFFIFY